MEEETKPEGVPEEVIIPEADADQAPAPVLV